MATQHHAIYWKSDKIDTEELIKGVENVVLGKGDLRSKQERVLASDSEWWRLLK